MSARRELRLLIHPTLHLRQVIVESALCRCHKALPGTETSAISAADNLVHGEVACIPALGSDVNPTDSTPLDTGYTVPPSRTVLELSSSSRTTRTATRELKENIGIKDLKELCIHCFLSTFFPEFGDETYSNRINALPLLNEEPFKLTSPPRNHASSQTQATRGVWPVNLDKSAYYLPLTGLLNEILDQFNHFGGKDVQFVTYDRPMAPLNPRSLKPGLFLVEDEFADPNPLHWKHPLIPLEVTNNFWRALKQLTRYARKLFSARPGRGVCWAFYFDHVRSKFRVILFMPDSVQYSKPVVVTSAAGYRDMVRLAVALLSRSDLLTVGEDLSRDSRTKLLPNGDRLEILGVEFDRKPFIGRKTRIISAVVVERGNTAVKYEKSRAEDDGYILKTLQRNSHETITFTNNSDHLEVGEHLVIKESWPVADRSDVEWNALTSCLGEFGVPEVVYRVTGKHPIPGGYARNPRVPQQLALKEKGLDLRDASSPRVLLTAVLHAIIGHWNLFRNGWLHRDVSIGNVLILKDPVQKIPPNGLDWLQGLTECRGMLIDGDAMMDCNLEREAGIMRVCTAPFLSRRLAEAWNLEDETFDQYFDDLESFAWVLLWALLEIAEANKVATAFDQGLFASLNRDDLESLTIGKFGIVSKLARLSNHVARNPGEVSRTSLSEPFIVILDRWFKLIESMELGGDAGSLPSDQQSTGFYKSIISIGMDAMAELPDVWPVQEQSIAS